MSLFYIVDGYNVIKRARVFSDLPLRQGRERFLAFLEIRRPHGSARNRLVVVFDGRPEVFGYQENRTFEVVFTAGESADDKIKAEVASAPNPKIVIVVTDDRDLRIAVRRLGARVLGTTAFLDQRSRTTTSPAGKGRVLDVRGPLNIVEREKITEECRRLWLERTIMISACLAGVPCVYDGTHNLRPALRDLFIKKNVFVFCPEVSGGLKIPHPPSEISGGDGFDVLAARARVVSCAGEDVTAAFVRGARRTLAFAEKHGIKTAVMKARSPSCGCGLIHDGTFTRTLKNGFGVTAALLAQNGIEVVTDEEYLLAAGF